MKSILIRLFSVLFSKFPKTSFRLANWFSNLKLYSHVTLLRDRGIELNVVYDIGARHGEYSKTLRRLMPESSFYLFEANQSCSKILDKTGFPYYISVLSSEDGKEVDFYSMNSSCDSFFKDLSGQFDGVTPKKIKTRSLSSIMEEHKLPYPDMIKLDTQGSELEILSGAGDLLSRCKVVHIEVPVIEANQGAPSLHQYLDFFQKRGFGILDITQQHHTNQWGELFQVDILFSK